MEMTLADMLMLRRRRQEPDSGFARFFTPQAAPYLPQNDPSMAPMLTRGNPGPFKPSGPLPERSQTQTPGPFIPPGNPGPMKPTGPFPDRRRQPGDASEEYEIPIPRPRDPGPASEEYPIPIPRPDPGPRSPFPPRRTPWIQ